MRSLRLALQFLTVFPVRVAGEVAPADLRKSLAWFPVVGLVLGGILGLLQRHVWAGCPDRLSCLLVVAAGIALTGCLHLDGLADVADALCARKDREGRLAVMKDPRVGAAGAAAIVLAILLRWELLASLGWRPRLLGILLAPAVGRSAMVVCLRALAPARSEGLAAAWSPAPASAVLLSLIIGIGAPFLVLGAQSGFLATVGIVMAVSLLLWAAAKAFGGLTGDVCGAAGEIAELAFLGSLLAA